jgi:hypothetical protein
MMTALYIIGGIVLLLVILVLVIPTDFKMERDIVINKPKDEVFSYIRSIKNQDNWSVWNMKDPGMKKEYRGTDGMPGFVYRWDGNKEVGNGEQEIKGIEEGKRVDMELRFEKPFKATNDGWLITEDAGSAKTKVTWGFSGKMPRPMNVFSLLMKGTLRKDFDAGLSNLKKVMEK